MILLFVHIQHLVFMVIIAVMNVKILLALISAKEHVHFFATMWKHILLAYFLM
jgi:hypothetical protein